MSHTRHALCRPGQLKFVVKGSVDVLESPISMEQRVGPYVAIKECIEEKGYPIAACALRHLARSAYHKWVLGKPSRRIVENEHLADRIEQIHEESAAGMIVSVKFPRTLPELRGNEKIQ